MEMEVIRITLEPTGKWFVADPRKYIHDEEHWYCIHNGTTSIRTLERSIEHQERSVVRDDQPVYVFEARNRTQIHEWLTSNGYVTNFQGRKTSTMTARERRIRTAELAIKRAQAEIDRVLRLPDEPTAADDSPLIIFFQKQFHEFGKIYDYSAIKAGDGLWYTTGPASPKGYTWDALVDWLYADEDFDPAIYQAKKFKPIVGA